MCVRSLTTIVLGSTLQCLSHQPQATSYWWYYWFFLDRQLFPGAFYLCCSLFLAKYWIPSKGLPISKTRGRGTLRSRFSLPLQHSPRGKAHTGRLSSRELWQQNPLTNHPKPRPLQLTVILQRLPSRHLTTASISIPHCVCN